MTVIKKIPELFGSGIFLYSTFQYENFIAEHS